MIKVTSKFVKREVKEAQVEIDAFAPGKVIVRAMEDGDGGDPYIVGDYRGKEMDHMYSSSERLDKYFSRGIFVEFFKQRADWLNASPEIKGFCDAAGKHPSEYRVGDQPLVSALTGDVCFMREV
tara:strand:+ start:130 stop:501 length:372 start_codon:yes stop_codon:yes gene_type:complete